MRIPESKVIIAGSYRLDEHINSKRKFEINHFNSHTKYILLLGDSTDFDEYNALLTISKILEDFGENWSCIYRLGHIILMVLIFINTNYTATSS
jgi:hypothetical protein